jgi:hypothetical protein
MPWGKICLMYKIRKILSFSNKINFHQSIIFYHKILIKMEEDPP